MLCANKCSTLENPQEYRVGVLLQVFMHHNLGIMKLSTDQIPPQSRRFSIDNNHQACEPYINYIPSLMVVQMTQMELFFTMLQLNALPSTVHHTSSTAYCRTSKCPSTMIMICATVPEIANNIIKLRMYDFSKNAITITGFMKFYNLITVINQQYW